MDVTHSVRKGLWWVLGLGLLTLVVGLAVSLRAVTVPLLLGLALAYLADPLVSRLEGRRISRSSATAIVGLGMLLAFAVLIGVMVPRIIVGLEDLPQALAQARDRIAPELEKTFGIVVPESWSEALEAVSSVAGSDGNGGVSIERVAAFVFGTSVSVGAAIVGLMIVPVLAFFISRDFPALKRRVRSLIPPPVRPEVLQRLREFDEMLGGFIRGQVVVAGVLGVMYAVGLLALGVRLAVVVAILSGIGNMIPYVGTALGILLASLLVMVEWSGWWQLLGVWGVYAAAQFIEGWFLTPRIVGRSATLPPLGVLIAVIGFGEMFGFFGLLLAVPLAAAVKISFNAFEEHFRQSPLFQERAGGVVPAGHDRPTGRPQSPDQHAG